MNPHFNKRNFLLHSLEGGLYMGGVAFLTGESVLPTMVHSLGGSEWLVSFMPVLLIVGFSSPVLFVVPLLNRLHRYKPTVLIGGLAQRLPYLAAALALFFFAETRPSWMLTIVVCAPLVSGIIGGLTINAWLEMVTRMIPERKRASGWAIRFIIQGVIGVAAGTIIHFILEQQPGPPGYAILHLIAFAFVMASLVAIFPMRETDLPDPKTHAGRNYSTQLLDILRKAVHVPEFLRYLWVRFTSVGYMLLAPYMAIHALAVTGRPEKDLGFFVASQMAGWIGGNFLAARVGDRRGGKAVMIAARLLLITVAMFVAFNSSFTGFVASFFAFGFAFAMDRVGDLTLGVELCPRDSRQGFLALLTFVLMPAMILAATTAAVIQITSGTFAYACLASVFITLVSLGLLLRIREPRNRRFEEPIS